MLLYLTSLMYWSCLKGGRGVVISSTSLTPPHFCDCPKSGSECPSKDVAVFSDIKWKVAIFIVSKSQIISRIVDLKIFS